MLSDQIKEVIFVGLPGPTHHYGGLSGDNVASTANRGNVSSPRQAALQVLDLVRLLLQLGQHVAILPPHLRPSIGLLRQHFTGDDASVIAQAAKRAPQLLEKATSASAMWTANAATVAPGIDCADGKLHVTTANLFTHLHRRIEAEDTHRVLKAIFAPVHQCEVHAPLAAAAGLYDEGAANHMRLSPGHSARGLHVFVYGTDGNYRDPAGARQTLSASHALASQHKLTPHETLFIKQNPDVIAQGVFHNDVIAVSHEHVLLLHEKAYENGQEDIERIAHAYRALHPGKEALLLTISEEELSVEEAVHTYFFNSQIVTRPDGAMVIIAPTEVKTLYDGKAARLMESLCEREASPIREIYYIDLHQSMKNGGGPACLRLRVPMSSRQLAEIADNLCVMADELLLAALHKLIETHYPAHLAPADLGKPELYTRCKDMLAELGGMMRLPLIPPLP
jgi:succinylarginine dihydrolase